MKMDKKKLLHLKITSAVDPNEGEALVILRSPDGTIDHTLQANTAISLAKYLIEVAHMAKSDLALCKMLMDMMNYSEIDAHNFIIDMREREAKEKQDE